MISAPQTLCTAPRIETMPGIASLQFDDSGLYTDEAGNVVGTIERVGDCVRLTVGRIVITWRAVRPRCRS